ncbi:MAG TPA: N-6 DNA methylase [Oligoflexia bacterium]|nr:N-6 DNA methylase [Oligoflexia bacterium]HMP26568.1 N-6 DNA methylase [Oligoflexia bacterium]
MIAGINKINQKNRQKLTRQILNKINALDVSRFLLSDSFDAFELNKFFSTDLFSLIDFSLSNGQGEKNIFLSNDELVPETYELIGNFEKIFLADERERNGVFYTPSWLGRRMAKTALEHFGGNPLNKMNAVCDLAVGSGVFLVALLDELYALNYQPDQIRDYLEGSLEAFDINPLAISAAKFFINLRLFELGASRAADLKIFLKDTLIGELEKKYDLIIGNPPFGISRQGKIGKDQIIFLQNRWQGILGGKIDKASVFLAKAFFAIKEDGLVSFVMPNSWCGIPSAENLRKLLMQENAIAEIETFAFAVFPKAQIEVVTVVLKRKSPFLKIRSLADKTNLTCEENHLSFESLQNYFNWQIPLGFSDLSYNFFKEIKQNSFTLASSDSPFVAYVGPQIYMNGKGEPPQTAEVVLEKPFHSKINNGSDSMRYLSGRDLKPFTVSWRGLYLRYGCWVAEFVDRAVFAKPRVLIREILGADSQRFFAAYTDQEYIYNRSILHVLLKRDDLDCKMLIALSGILNSRVGSEIISLIGKKACRKLFPKVILADINCFPLPTSFFSGYQRIADKVLEIQTQGRSEKLYFELDLLVRKIYSGESPNSLDGQSLSLPQRSLESPPIF